MLAVQVLENSTGGTQGTLLAAVDNCATPAGRRLLRQWLVRPLGRVAVIEARQDAVAALMGPAAEAAARARKQFAGAANS
jgi:DNA mismatch repair protein MSH6